ncbi:MAG: dihydrolipoyl dehydrogenase [Planctomycetota bacterium]|jgi:dihydrolipoamide dehydrogenase
MKHYDIAILGGGPGGYTAALRAAQRDANVCLIEKGHLGGACLNVGCIPTKALLHAGEVAWAAGQADALGVAIDGVSVDGPALMRRVSRTVASLRKGVAQLLKARGVDVIVGRGRLTSPTTIHVETREDNGKDIIRSRAVIAATGARPIIPPFAPAESPRVLTSDDATVAGDLPQSILIIGGGAIGCEFATLYAELGVKVVLVEMCDRLLPTLDVDASRAITRSLRQRGVHVRTETTVETMHSDATAVSTDLSISQRIVTHTALLAVGRRPNLDDLDVEGLGIELADELIKVDSRCRTSAGGLYAIGDIASAKQYAHVAARMAIVAADTATGHNADDDLTVVPECVYTHPQVASVGLSEIEARENFRGAKCTRFGLRASGMAQATGQVDGFVKLIAHEDTGEILGGLIVAPSATEMIQEISLAMRNQLSIYQLADTIHAHPTFAETIHEASELWAGVPIHTVR